jgi:integrase
MASIQKIDKGYRAQVYVKGTRDSQVFPTRREAVAWAAQREAEIRDVATKPLGEQHTLRQALRRYADEVSPTKRGERWEVVRLAAFEDDRLPLDIPIGRVTAQHIADFRDSRTAKVKPGTVLRELTLLSAVFQTCRLEWGWVDSNPCHDIRRPPAPRHRERTLHWREIRALLREMGYQRRGRVTSMGQAVAVCLLVALHTGMRAGELCGLTWDHVHARHAHLPLTKNGKARDVPLSSRAVALIARMRGWDNVLVFGLKPQSLDALFRKYRARAGLDGFTWHDTRHTAATMLARKVDVLTLCKIFGWSSTTRALVYFNPSASSIADMLG